MILRTAVAAAIALVLVGAISPAASAADAPPPSRKKVEKLLAAQGFPVGKVDGHYDSRTRRALCAWRELTGKKATRALPTKAEAIRLTTQPPLKAPRGLRDGVAINVRCQTAYHLVDGEVRRVMAATTGRAGYRTRLGSFRIYRYHRGWHESSIYHVPMYRPMYFSGAMALHGSATDALVKSRPASHGCVRLKHRDMDYLWRAGLADGGPVYVYGKWKG